MVEQSIYREDILSLHLRDFIPVEWRRWFNFNQFLLKLLKIIHTKMDLNTQQQNEYIYIDLDFQIYRTFTSKSKCRDLVIILMLKFG